MGEVAGVGDASAATPCYTRRVDTLLWLGAGGMGCAPAPSLGPSDPSGHGVVLTLIEPSMIFFLASSSLLWMSLMKPPLVESFTPSLASE